MESMDHFCRFGRTEMVATSQWAGGVGCVAPNSELATHLRQITKQPWLHEMLRNDHWIHWLRHGMVVGQTLFLPYIDYHIDIYIYTDYINCSCCCGTYCHGSLHVTVAPFYLKFWRMTGCWLLLFCDVLFMLLLGRYSQTTDIELKPPSRSTRTRRITGCEFFNFCTS